MAGRIKLHADTVWRKWCRAHTADNEKDGVREREQQMATGTGVGATILTALKAHLAAVAIGATVVVAGGTAAAAVATGAIHPPAQASAAHADKTPGARATEAAANGATARASACD